MNESGVNTYQSAHFAKLHALVYSVGQTACLVLQETLKG